MKHPQHWTPEDKAELAEIETARQTLRKRRERLFAKIRQRAWRAGAGARPSELE